MKTSNIILIVVAIVVIIGGGYWYWNTTQSSSTSPASVSTDTASTQTALMASTVSQGSSAQFPSYLTAANGMALYTYNADTSGVSNCTGSCAGFWPPYTVSSAADLSAASGVSGTLGTIKRADGSVQVTYNGMPLYFFVQDKNSGQVTGDGIQNFAIATPATVSVQKTTPVKTAAPAAPVAAPVKTAPTSPSPYNYNY